MTALILYVIRDKATKKYYRVPKNCMDGSKLELVSGINKAQTYVQNDDGGFRTAQYVVCKHGITGCEIVACYNLENMNKGRLFNREIKGAVWSN
jgi:hypothetical protein